MTPDRTSITQPHDEPARDASDIVAGPVGSSHLKDPATSGPVGADLDELPAIDGADEPAVTGVPIDGVGRHTPMDGKAHRG